MSTQVEEVMDSSMGTQKSLSLTDRLEPSECRTTHHSLSHPGRLMRLLCSIVGISSIVVNNVRYKFSTSNTITA
jgi:hypothetical protein